MNAPTERESILQRIREATAHPAPFPGDHDGHCGGSCNDSGPEKTQGVQGAQGIQGAQGASAGKWLPRVESTSEEQFALFEKNSVDLKTNFRLFETREEMAAALLELAREEGWKSFGTHRGDLTDACCASLGLPSIDTSSPFDAHQLEACDAGISQCDALVAQTGSVLITARSAGGRALSVLPPHHVVLATRDQLVADLPAAFALLKARYQENFPSLISLITGPSRTGDIERILVLGAHGPKKLTVFCAHA